MQTKTVIVLLLLTAYTLLLPSYGTVAYKDENHPHVVKEKSFFDDFTVVDRQVFFQYHLVVENRYNKDIKVEIFGDFSRDVTSELVIERSLAGYQAENMSNHEFVLSPGENDLNVVFIGTHGISDQKQDRLLPDDMVVVILNDIQKVERDVP